MDIVTVLDDALVHQTKLPFLFRCLIGLNIFMSVKCCDGSLLVDSIENRLHIEIGYGVYNILKAT